MSHQDNNYNLDLKPPSPEILQWAKENIGEDPETRNEVISKLRNIIFGKFA